MGRLLALILAAATVVLIVMGTVWPIPSAAAYAGITCGGTRCSLTSGQTGDQPSPFLTT